MELHLVHKAEDGELAVVALLMEIGDESPLISTIWEHAPWEAGEREMPTETIDANQFLPAMSSYFTYYGSLTTPPCTEGVRWFVMQAPVKLSTQQVWDFNALFSESVRPIQPLNNRIVRQGIYSR